VNRNQPQYSGAQGAAAGAAAANRNSPQYSGAQGAAAGAAAANRNQPQYSGAQGAAVGAAAANRNQPQYSGAQGAALGAAVANQNAPQFSGAQGAALGASAANQNATQSSAVQGGALAAAALNQNAPAAMNTGAAAGIAAVRNSFSNSNLHTQQWYGNNPTAWSPAGWTPEAAWRQPAWTDVAAVRGDANSIPISYDYGVNIVAQNGNVIFNGQNVGPVGEFSQQAYNLADSGAAAQISNTDQWLPLGVFAMVRNEQQHPQLIVQLAVNRQGVLRGNYTDNISDNTLSIQGAVDKNTQRAAGPSAPTSKPSWKRALPI
jgi:hypothetical protein